jgi:hypothetical protein
MPSVVAWICSPHHQFASSAPLGEARDTRRRSRAKLHNNGHACSPSTSGSVAANFARNAIIVAAGVTRSIFSDRSRARRARLPRCSARAKPDGSSVAGVRGRNQRNSLLRRPERQRPLTRACLSADAIARCSAKHRKARCNARIGRGPLMLRPQAIPRVAREDNPPPLAPWRRRREVHPGRGRGS